MSLRAQKNLATRRALQSAALILFEQRGYDDVTVEQVAEAAGSSASTLYRHFGCKEQLVLWDEADWAIEKRLEEGLGMQAPLAALHAAFRGAYSDLSQAELDLLARRSALVDGVPEVFAAMAAGLERNRRELQQALVWVYRRPELEMEMVARFALSALVAGFELWQDQGVGADLPGCIDEAFAAGRGALH